MTSKEIIFEKLPLIKSSYQDVLIITIFDNPPRVSTKSPVRITSVPRSTPLIITIPRPISYSSDKAVPQSYGADVYYYGVKQYQSAVKDEVARDINPDIGNITRTSKITRSGRVLSPEISPKTIVTPMIIPTVTPIDTPSDTPTVIPATDTRGKEVLIEPAQARERPEIILEASKKEIEEILKIIKKSDYNIFE